MLFKKQNEKNEDVTFVSEELGTHSAWIRLNSQLKWYSDKSVKSQKRYKQLKFLQVFFAVSIPVVSHIDSAFIKWLISGAGALIAILESVQHMNQYSTLWVTYRSTAECLEHEKFLFLASAGLYRELEEKERLMLLAERVEEIISTDHSRWVNIMQKSIAPSRGKESK